MDVVKQDTLRHENLSASCSQKSVCKAEVKTKMREKLVNQLWGQEENKCERHMPVPLVSCIFSSSEVVDSLIFRHFAPDPIAFTKVSWLAWLERRLECALACLFFQT